MNPRREALASAVQDLNQLIPINSLSNIGRSTGVVARAEYEQTQ